MVVFKFPRDHALFFRNIRYVTAAYTDTVRNSISPISNYFMYLELNKEMISLTVYRDFTAAYDTYIHSYVIT